MVILFDVYHTKISAPDIDRDIIGLVHTLQYGHLCHSISQLSFDQVLLTIPMEWKVKLDLINQVINTPTAGGLRDGSQNQELGCSPGPSAPIQDLLYRP